MPTPKQKIDKRKRYSHIWHKGNCLDLIESLPDNSIDLVYTSPPYNIGKEYESRKGLSEYLSLQAKTIYAIHRILSPTGSVCWQIGNYVEGNGSIIPLDILVYDIFGDKGFKLRNRIIWQYQHGLNFKNRFSGRYESILWFSKSDKYTFNLDSVRVPQKWPNKKYYKGPKQGQFSCNPLGKNPGDVWEMTNIKNGHPEKIPGGHPCQTPVQIVERLILALTKERDAVLDPFGGVATTVVTALEHNRIGLGAEINSKYHKLGKKRIQDCIKGRLTYHRDTQTQLNASRS